jgi:intein/homing endonuclease
MKIKRNENTAELVGLSFGDGGLTYRTGKKRLRFQLRGSLEEDKEHYDNYIIPLFNREVCIPIFNKNVGIVFNKNAGFYGLSKESEKLVCLSEDLRIPIGVKRELSIPNWIKENTNYIKRFLRGFFDTDGTITCQRNYSIKNQKVLVCTSA